MSVSSGNFEPTCTTPWPTLRMCRRPPAFAIVLPTASLMTDSLPNSTIGSMLPCTSVIGTVPRPSANMRREVRLANHELMQREQVHAPGWCAPAPAWHVHPQCPLPSPAQSHRRCTHLSTAASLSLWDNMETHAQQLACIEASDDSNITSSTASSASKTCGCAADTEAPPLAWKMRGVSGCCALTPSMTRCAYGRLNSRNCCGDRWCAHESNSCTTCSGGAHTCCICFFIPQWPCGAGDATNRSPTTPVRPESQDPSRCLTTMASGRHLQHKEASVTQTWRPTCAPLSIWWQTYTTSASVNRSSSSRRTSGLFIMMRLVCRQCLHRDMEPLSVCKLWTY